MNRALRYAAKCLLLAAGYFGAVKGGLAFAVVHDFISLVWPASGLALVALTLMGLRFFPALVVGGLAPTRCTAAAPDRGRDCVGEHARGACRRMAPRPLARF